MKNSLKTLSQFESLIDLIPNIKRLHIGENNLLDLKELNSLSSLADTLTELVLINNPLYNKPSDDEQYIK